MATATGTYIAVDELRATLSSTTANYVSEIYATSDTTTAQLVKRMWLNDSSNYATIVWDVWNTVLTATIEDMPSAGGDVEDYLSVSSYGTDAEGGNHTLGYSVSPESISPTTSGSTTTKTVTVTQDGSGESVQLTAYIAGRVAQSTSYGTPSVTSTSISTVAASGNVTRYLTVYWSQTKTVTYDNGTTSSETVTGSSTATVTSGSANNSSGAYISSGGVYVPSAGTTYYTSQRTVYTISGYSFTANGVSRPVSSTVYVYQSANTRSTYYRNYNVSLSSSRTSVNPASDTATITVTSTKESYYLYSSGSEQTIGSVSCNANLSTSDGQFYVNGSYSTSATLTNGGSVTFVPNANETVYDRTLSIKAVNAESSSATYSLKITQLKAEFELSVKGETSIGASGGTIALNVVNTINGGFLTLGTSNVSVTNGYVESVVFNDITMDSWTVTVVINPNTTSNSRTSVVTITQPKSGNVETHAITQSAASSGQTTYKTRIDAWWDGYNVWYTVLVSSSSSGYEEVDVTIKLQDTTDRYGTVYHQEDVSLITDMDEYNNSYDLGYYIEPLYVVVYHDNEIIGYRNVD